MTARFLRVLLALALVLGPSGAFAQNAVVTPAPQDVPGATYLPSHAQVGACEYFATPLAALVGSGFWGLTCDATGALRVNVVTSVAAGGGGSSGPVGNAGTNSATAAYVQGVTGGIPQNVAGTVAVNNFPGTQPVTGAFYQATQPVSIAGTIPVSFATPLPVTGAFYQATQPVSGSVTQLGSGGNTMATDANGVQSSKVCDATTSTQCAAVDTVGGVKLSTTATTGLLASTATAGYVRVGNGSSNATIGTTSSDGQVLVTSLYASTLCTMFNGTNVDRCRKDTYAAGPQWMTTGGSTTAAIAAGTAGPSILKNSAGRLVQLIVTTAGTTSETCLDSSSANSGTIVGITPATTTVGQVLKFDTPTVNGITCFGGTGSPALTASYF